MYCDDCYNNSTMNCLLVITFEFERYNLYQSSSFTQSIHVQRLKFIYKVHVPWPKFYTNNTLHVSGLMFDPMHAVIQVISISFCNLLMYNFLYFQLTVSMHIDVSYGILVTRVMNDIVEHGVIYYGMCRICLLIHIIIYMIS